MFRMFITTGMNNMYQYGFIGLGNMGSAMMQGCIGAGLSGRLAFSRKDEKKGQAVSEETGVPFLKNAAECAGASKCVILAVKPQVYPAVLPQIKEVLTPDKIIISLAPSYTIADLKQILGENIRIVRAMPNTPASVGAGMTGICFSDDVYTEEEKEMLGQFFNSFGRVETVNEKLMAAVTAASGSSPAFIFMMMEALADGVVACGMPRSQAYTFVAQTVLGSAKLMLETGEHPGALKDAVCSPGGTTIEGVAVLEEAGFRSSLIKAAKAVFEKCQ